MSDQYFKNKAEELLKLIDSAIEDGDEESIKKYMYLSLKEVAKDQRYACVEAVGNYTDSAICGIIQNANIKILTK